MGDAGGAGGLRGEVPFVGSLRHSAVQQMSPHPPTTPLPFDPDPLLLALAITRGLSSHNYAVRIINAFSLLIR